MLGTMADSFCFFPGSHLHDAPLLSPPGHHDERRRKGAAQSMCGLLIKILN